MAYNWYLLLPVLCPRGWRSWSVLSRCWSRCRWLNGCRAGQCYVGDRLLLMQHAPPPPPSPCRWWVQRNSRTITVWHQRRRRSCQNEVEYNNKLLQRLQLLIFPQGLLLKPFPKKGNCKATVIIARWPPLALQDRRPLTDLVLTSIWVSSHLPHNLPCEKCWGCRFSHRRLDPEAGITGLQVTSRKSMRADLTP